jgi:hypothetical protein
MRGFEVVKNPIILAVKRDAIAQLGEAGIKALLAPGA